uniref:Uncharacterized protein n=1 Tax=Castor canadensis TaxID=51338 RepID=A0A8C0ZP34_CASCN
VYSLTTLLFHSYEETELEKPSPIVAGLPSGSRLTHAGPVYSSIWGCFWHQSVGFLPRIPSPFLASSKTAILSVLPSKKQLPV